MPLPTLLVFLFFCILISPLLCVFRLPADKQKSALDVGYKIFASEGSYPNIIRCATVQRVCLPMLRLVHKAALIEFFLDHIQDLMKTVELRLSRVCRHCWFCGECLPCVVTVGFVGNVFLE